MNLLLVFLCGFLPTLIVVALCVRYVGRKSSLVGRHVVLAFMMGLIAAVPAYYLQVGTHALFELDERIWWHVLLMAFLVVALLEEFFKMIQLKLTTRFVPIDSPKSLLVLSVVIAMGFAGVENVLYSNAHGWEVALFRSLTSIPAHACFALMIAYFPAVEFEKKALWQPYFYGLIPAVFLHGWYDFFIIQEWSEPLMLMAIIVLVISLFLAYRVIRRVKQSSVDGMKMMP